MELPTPTEVLDAIDAFLARHGMAPSRFGAEATGDANLVASMRKGLSPRLNRLHRIKAYMARIDVEAGHGVASAASDGVASSGKADDLSAEAGA